MRTIGDINGTFVDTKTSAPVTGAAGLQIPTPPPLNNQPPAPAGNPLKGSEADGSIFKK